MIKTAVVTGGHAFDVVNFHQLFRNLPQVDAYIQSIDDFSVASQEVRDAYDAVVFYIMMPDTPPDEGLPWYMGKPKTALSHLGSTRQGLVILHHALLAYPNWPVWDEIVGIRDRKFGFFMDQAMHYRVEKPAHPITQGIKDFDMVDESYTMNDATPENGNEVLLTVEHPNSMHTIAWTRQFKESRVFCFEGGHDNSAYANPNFKALLANGIRWSVKGS